MVLQTVEDPAPPTPAERAALRSGAASIDHSEYFSAPESVRLGYHLLHNAGLIPEELRLRCAISELEQQLSVTKDRDQRCELLHQIDPLHIRLDLLA